MPHSFKRAIPVLRAWHLHIHFDISASWNTILTAKEAVDAGVSPIIIDNTNVQSWEMKPYVALVRMLLPTLLLAALLDDCRVKKDIFLPSFYYFFKNIYIHI